MGWLNPGAPRRLPALRFGVKITLAFIAVLSICAASMLVAHTGLARIAVSDAAYRASVAEADASREIDRELVSFQAMARYFAVTGRDDDAAAVLVTQNALKSAITRAMTVIAAESRREQIVKIDREFERYARVFAELAGVKSETSRIAADRVVRSSVAIRASLEELADTAALAGLPAIQSTAKDLTSQFMAVAALANSFILRPDARDAGALVGTIRLIENAYGSIVADDAAVARRVAGIADRTRDYREALNELAAKSTAADRLVAEMADGALTITLLSNAMKQDLMADQQRMEGESASILFDTKQQVALLAIGGALIGGLLALVLGRAMSRRMRQMCAAMHKLAGGQFNVRLPGLGTRDEFGDMAAAVEQFKVQAMTRAAQDAAANEALARIARDARRAELARFADEFEAAVGAIVTSVSASSIQLEAAADTLLRTAETTQDLSSHVSGASEEASSNMQAVAAATEQLTASVEEIGRRVRDSSTIAEGAVLQARQTDARIGDLSSAAQRIGDVVKLITAIAGKTNLLALNATIEAARAGEAGRGFAVVASEVKLLAGQTAKATGEISAHIAGIQNATAESVVAIKGVGDTIGMISGIASTIACAVEQQNSATQEIARNIHGVARGAHDVAENIARVTRGANETGVASGQVLSSATTLAAESRRLRHELDRFMANFRAA